MGVLSKCESSMVDCRDWQQSSSVPRGIRAWMLPVPAKMSNCPLREPYFSPSFSHISPPTDLICVSFVWIIYIPIKNTVATKLGHNKAVLGQIPHFGPFPLEKISTRGCQKGGNSTFTKYTFQTLGWFGIIKEVLLSYLGWKEALIGEWWPKMWKLSTKIWTGIQPRPLGWSDWPQLCGPSRNVHQTWSASKKSHFRTFAPSTPSGIVVWASTCNYWTHVGHMYMSNRWRREPNFRCQISVSDQPHQIQWW
jgi:hypothetical protein